MTKEDTCGDPSQIERCMALTLRKRKKYVGELEGTSLNIILANVMKFLIEQEKVAGVEGLIACQVTKMQATIETGKMIVVAAANITKPIWATLVFSYALENGAHPGTLMLHQNKVQVTESTKTFDLGAKIALKAMNVPEIAHQKLSRPGEIIRQTLPARLQAHGVSGSIDHIALTLQERSLYVSLAMNPS